jgi:hypothetical protein
MTLVSVVCRPAGHKKDITLSPAKSVTMTRSEARYVLALIWGPAREILRNATGCSM